MYPPHKVFSAGGRGSLAPCRRRRIRPPPLAHGKRRQSRGAPHTHTPLALVCRQQVCSSSPHQCSQRALICLSHCPPLPPSLRALEEAPKDMDTHQKIVSPAPRPRSCPPPSPLLTHQVTSLAANIRDLICRTRFVVSSRSRGSSGYQNHLPYPVAVVQQVAAVVGW
jgi:hypothetical protein